MQLPEVSLHTFRLLIDATKTTNFWSQQRNLFLEYIYAFVPKKLQCSRGMQEFLPIIH